MYLLFDVSNNVTTIIAAVLIFFGTVFSGIMAYLSNKKITKVQKNTDGLVEKLLIGKDETSQAKQETSKAEGKAEGIAEKQIEVDQLNKEAQPNNKKPL